MHNKSPNALLKCLALVMIMTASSAHATRSTTVTLSGCGLGDLTGANACSGYFAGNINSGNGASILLQQSALASIGLDWDGNFGAVEKIESFAGNDIDFGVVLTGTSFVSVHWGAGQGPVHTPGGTTAFYRIDALSGLGKLVSAFGSLSNAVLYKTAIAPPGGGGGGPAPLPEPLVWVELMLGLAFVGSAIRQRRMMAAA